MKYNDYPMISFNELQVITIIVKRVKHNTTIRSYKGMQIMSSCCNEDKLAFYIIYCNTIQKRVATGKITVGGPFYLWIKIEIRNSKYSTSGFGWWIESRKLLRTSQ